MKRRKRFEYLVSNFNTWVMGRQFMQLREYVVCLGCSKRASSRHSEFGIFCMKGLMEGVRDNLGSFPGFDLRASRTLRRGSRAPPTGDVRLRFQGHFGK